MKNYQLRKHNNKIIIKERERVQKVILFPMILVITYFTYKVHIYRDVVIEFKNTIRIILLLKIDFSQLS